MTKTGMFFLSGMVACVSEGERCAARLARGRERSRRDALAEQPVSLRAKDLSLSTGVEPGNRNPLA